MTTEKRLQNKMCDLHQMQKELHKYAGQHDRDYMDDHILDKLRQISLLRAEIKYLKMLIATREAKPKEAERTVIEVIAIAVCLLFVGLWVLVIMGII
ncbi:hypothetical protein GCM10027051_16130 [Niabella terrae]